MTCAGVAVFSAGGGPEVHVLRRGMLDQRNPLAPSTNVPPATVLEVTIRGKLAAAYGPTFQEMRRAGPPQELEREIGNPIRWGPNLAELPHDIVIVGDNREVIANLRYLKCLPQPKAIAGPRRRREFEAQRGTIGEGARPCFSAPTRRARISSCHAFRGGPPKSSRVETFRFSQSSTAALLRSLSHFAWSRAAAVRRR